MSAVPPLAADRDQLQRFVNALFAYADPGGFVSLRGFLDNQRGPPAVIEAMEVGDDLAPVTDAAERIATRCARLPEPVVFSPPVATFSNARQAREADLANGLALSVELDANPAEGRRKLEAVLGPATVIVASGGEWTDPATGEVVPKLHAHWRLTEPTRTPLDHARLKAARILATQLAGGDPSNQPIVHPIRWPGSWHRKAAPRLARIVAEPGGEVDLTDALERLSEAVGGAQGASWSTDSGNAGKAAGEAPRGEARDTAKLVRAILAAEDYHMPIAALAMRFLKAGMPDAQAVVTLRGIMDAVPESIRDVKNGTAEPGRWQSRYDDIPRAVSTARAKLGTAAREGAAEDDEWEDEWPEPLDFLGADDMTGPPQLRPDHLPDALAPFAFDTAERMGVDPATVALAAIVAVASIASDDFQLQPKRLDDTWTEAPRLWGAIVGDPSILKTPVIRAATRPLDALDKAARERHAAAAQKHKADLAAWKEQGSDPASEPRMPPLERYLVEGATVEAISEALRDDFQAKQCAPAGKVLVRQDELSEFLANLDRYRGGGRGGGDRGAYLRLFNGGRFTVDRIQRGSFAVPNWSATFLGGIQPEPIQRIAREAADDGLLQRFLYAVPAAQGEGQDRQPNREAQERYDALFLKLAEMRPAKTVFGGAAKPIVLHADAHQHREGVNNLARALAAMPDTSPRLRAAYGKWPGIFARLALVFHLVNVADANAQGREAPYLGVVPADTAARAANYMRDIVLPHLLRAEALMFLTPQSGHARWVAGWLLAHRMTRVAVRDVQRAYGALRPPEQRRELEAVMDSLAVMGWLRAEPSDNPARGATAWTVNPKLHTIFAARAAAEVERRQRALREVTEAARRYRAGAG